MDATTKFDCAWTGLQAGFIRGEERRVLSRSDLAQEKTIELVFCPYDRAECKDQMMALTMRVSESTTLVLGFRSMPFWPDLSLGEADKAGTVDDAGTRENLSGISVVFVRDALSMQFTDRALLNFNSLFSTFPDGMQSGPNVRHQCFRFQN